MLLVGQLEKLWYTNDKIITHKCCFIAGDGIDVGMSVASPNITVPTCSCQHVKLTYSLTRCFDHSRLLKENSTCVYCTEYKACLVLTWLCSVL